MRTVSKLKAKPLDSEVTIREYLALFRRRWWIVAATTVVLGALALIWSASQTPKYRSSANLLINQNSSSVIFDPVGGSSFSYAERLIENEARFLESQLVADEAIARLEFDGTVSVRTDGTADVLVVSAVSPDPQQAQITAQTYAEAYIDVRRNQFVNERLDTAKILLERIDEIDAEIADASGDDLVRLQLLRRDLADSFDRLSITADLAEGTGAQIIDDAFRPRNPFSPQTRRNTALGILVGLMAGVGLALLIESLDHSVRTRQVLESATQGVPALALIPTLSKTEGVIAVLDPNGVEAEAFRSLRAAIEFAAVDRDISVIQVTSAGAAAGKTTLAANLAAVLAQSGYRVAVVDGDLRRPRMHQVFGVPQVPGLTSIVLGRETFESASQSIAIDNGSLAVVASGPIPAGPSELLGSERASETMRYLRGVADKVIIDSPPILPVADALVLSRYVDATILVANARRTRREGLARAYEQLRQSGAPVIGTVLNEVSRRGLSDYSSGYGYGYGYGYGHGKEDAPRTRRSRRNADTTEPIRLAQSEVPRFDAAPRVVGPRADGQSDVDSESATAEPSGPPPLADQAASAKPSGPSPVAAQPATTESSDPTSASQKPATGDPSPAGADASDLRESGLFAGLTAGWLDESGEAKSQPGRGQRKATRTTDGATDVADRRAKRRNVAERDARRKRSGTDADDNGRGKRAKSSKATRDIDTWGDEIIVHDVPID